MEFYHDKTFTENGIVYRVAVPSDYIGRNVEVEEGAVIEQYARIGNNCRIGAGSLIKDCARIFDNVVIGKESHIGVGAEICAGTRIGNATLICNYASVGAHTIVDSHSVVGVFVRVPNYCHVGQYAKIQNRSRVDLVYLDNVGLTRDDITFWRHLSGGIMVNSGRWSGTLDQFCKKVESEITDYVSREMYNSAINLVTVQMLNNTGGNGE